MPMTTYYAEFGMRDGKRVPITLFRRETPGDVKSDGAYSKDGSWPFTTALALWMKNLGASNHGIISTPVINATARAIYVASDDNGGTRVDLPLSQEELASWIGASREATVKALRTLREIGAITTGRRVVTIVDRAALTGVARRA